MISEWNYHTLNSEQIKLRDQLASDLAISPAICTLLVQRGISSTTEAKNFSVRNYQIFMTRS